MFNKGDKVFHKSDSNTIMVIQLLNEDIEPILRIKGANKTYSCTWMLKDKTQSSLFSEVELELAE